MPTFPDYPDQTALAPVAWAAAFSSLILEIEDEPGHYVDLAKILDADDTPDEQTLLLTLPAPHFDSDGPHCILLRGESRDLALRYLRFRATMTRALLLNLPA